MSVISCQLSSLLTETCPCLACKWFFNHCCTCFRVTISEHLGDPVDKCTFKMDRFQLFVAHPRAFTEINSNQEIWGFKWGMINNKTSLLSNIRTVVPTWRKVRIVCNLFYELWVFFLHVCLCNPYMPGALGSQKRALHPLKLELGTLVGAGNWTLVLCKFS